MKVITRAQTIIHLVLIVGMLISSIGPAGFAQTPAQAATPGNELHYAYDEAGRLSGVVDPAAGSAAYRYDDVGNVVAISRQPATQATLIEFTPNAGSAGATVTLFGTGFSTTATENTVKFNGVSATVTSATATELVVRVPSGATTGPIMITSPAGTVASSAAFTVTTTSAAPQITSFTPNTGTAGATVTIDGVNFETSIANNRVQFNGIYASLTEATATRITATVPVRAGSGRLSVTTPAGKAVSSTDFFVPPAPFTAADIELTDRMALGENKTVALNTANKIGMILFDGTQGQQVSLRLSAVTLASSSVAILSPDGNTLTSTSVGTSGSFLDAKTLPATGTYTILVDPSSTYTGGMTLSLYDASNLTAMITPGGPAVAITTTVPGQNARLSFNGTQGQKVSVSLSGVTISSGSVSLLRPDGSSLGSTSINTSGGFLDTRTLPSDGVYTVLIDPSSTHVGNITATLYDVPDSTASIAIGGAATSVTTTVPGQNASLTFNGSANQRVSLLVNTTTKGYDLSILRPDGTVLVNPTYVTANELIDTRVLPADGTYTIVVNPRTVDTLSTSLTLYNVPADVTGAIVPGGAAVGVTTTVPGQNASLTFNGSANQRVSLLVNTTTKGYDLSILKPDGTALLSPTYVTANEFIDTRTLPVDGTYTIVINPRAADTLSTSLTLYDVPADLSGAITAGGAATSVTTTVPGQNARLTFTGTTNQRISLLVSATTKGYDLSILKPDGTALLSSTYVTANEFIDTRTLPVDGTYTIVINPRTADTLSTTLALYDVPADVGGTLTLGGPAQTVTITTPGQNARLTFDGTQGQQISLNLSGVTISSSSISILNPDGTTLASATVGTSGSSLSPVLPATGTYAVVINPAATNTGTITLSLFDATDVTGTIVAGGPTITVTTTVAGQNARLTFAGTTNQRISLLVSTATKSYDLSILKPDGTALLNPTSVSANSFIDTRVLPADGTYTILVNPRNADLLTTGLKLYDVPADLSGPIMPGGAAVGVTTTVAGQNASLTFSGSANQRISLLVNTATKGYDLSILRPDGTALLNSTYVTANEFIDTRTLPVDGTYTIVINPRTVDTLSTSLTLYNVPADVTGAIVPGGAAVGVTTTVPGQNASLTFTGTTNQRISLLVSAATRSYDLSILRPDGTALVNPTSASASSFIDTRVLPVDGTYTIVVNPRTADTLSTSLTLYNVPADLSGAITTDGAATSVTTTVPGQNARLTFTGTTNQRVSLKVNSATKSYDLSILKPDGTALVNPTSASANSFIDTRVLPVDGTYTIVVNPRTADTLSTTLALYDVPADLSGAIVPGGAAVTTALTVPGQNARLTFTGTTNQRVSLHITGVTIANASVSILKPDGTALVSLAVGTSGGFIDTRVLPADGTYTIVVDPSVANTGNATLTLYNVVDLNTTILANSTPVTVTTTVPGQNARLTFTGTTNQRVSLRLSGVTITSSSVSILKPDGTALVAATTINTSGGFIDTRVLPADGTYTIVVDPSTTSTGTMVLTLYTVPADVSGTLSIGGAAQTVTLATPGQNARLTFDGAASQRINLVMSAVSISSSTVSILRPDGTSLTSTSVSTTGRTISPTLPVAGTYTIVIDPASANTGSMTLTLSQYASAAGLRLVQARPLDVQIARVSLSISGTFGAPAAPPAAGPDQPAAQSDDEGWVPDPRNLRNWTTGRPRSTWQDLAPLQAKPGVTGLAGQVLTLKGQPLANVTLEIDEHTVTTDNTGRFLFAPIEPGRHELVIDGSTANKPGRSYGLFEAAVHVAEGYTNILPYTIWMTKLDTAHTVKVSSPVAEDVVLTTPYVPGLEVRIPKGAIITDEDGQPVTEIGITPIPIDRPPFPLPKNNDIPIYFTVQPGGAYVKPAARVIYPNYNDLAPGTETNFWNYDPGEKEWYIYGHGTVTPDGKQVVPDARTKIYEFTGAMFNAGNQPPPDGPTPGNDDDDGDPVDLSTGIFVMDKTDLAVADTLPIQLTRTYRPGDTRSRAFGIGATHPYEMWFWSALQYEEVDLILPDGGRIHYDRISPGTGFTDAVFEHTETPTAFYKSIVAWNGNGWDLTLQDGTVYIFGDEAPLQAIRDRHGNQITISRSSVNVYGSGVGNITQIHSSNGRWIAFSYDSSDRVTEARDNIGRTVRYQYDADGRLWKVTDPAGGVTEYTYDTANRMLTIKDARGLTFLTNQYDASGRVSRQTQADGSTYLFAYTLDASGKVTQTDVTNPRGQVRRVAFNASGQTVSDSYAVGTPLARTISYDLEAGTDLLLGMTDPGGRRTTYTYDAMGNVTSVTRLAGTASAITTRYTYDSRYRQVSSITDPLGRTQQFAYDAKGNLVTTTDALGRRATMAYNAAGQVVTITNPLSHATRFTYDTGDLVAITNPLGQVTRRFIDSAGRMVTQTNPLGQAVRYDYNALSLPTKQTDPLGAVTTTAYDANGNTLSITDARGSITRYTYDNMDRQASRTDPLGGVERYSYDAGGNLTQITDRKGQVTSFRYDALGRNTFAGYGTTQRGGTTSYDSTIAYTYDAVSRLSQLADSRTGTIAFTYDDLDRLTRETTPQGTVSYTHDASSRQTSMTVAGRPTVVYTYDAADRLTQVAQGPATVGMRYDDASRLTSMTLPTGVRMDYSHNDASQLTGITYKLGTATIGDLSYSYDAVGQLKRQGGSYARTGLPQALASATYDAANRLTRWGNVNLTYDANGNLTGDGTSTYTWNTRNQLTTINGGGVSAGFQYDATGRRIGKTVNGTTTNFLYNGSNVVQEQAGGTPSVNLLTGQGIDQTFTRTDASGTQTLLTDRLGSTLGLVDSTGAMQTAYTYDPFGNTTASGAASSNPSQFTGRENDGTGLYYYRARYYSPTLQRFISEDPIGFAGGDVNLYAYVGNSPLNYTDPSGHCGVDIALDAGFIGYDLYKLFTGGRKDLGDNLTNLGLDVVGAVIPCATGLGAARRAATHADDLLGAVNRACSFSGDTPVATADGQQLISEVEVGDEVLAYDEETGTTGSYTVTDVWSHKDPVVERLTLNDDVIETTPEHPFYTEERGWVAAGHLWVGAQVRTADGTSATVEAIAFEHRSERMYNLTVDQAHTFFVGDDQLLVHNTCLNLVDGMRASTDDALDTAEQFLGPGYRDMGDGRFLSADGTRQVRMGDSDILGHHGGGPHMNFETLAPNPAKPGKMHVVDNKHIYLDP